MISNKLSPPLPASEEPARTRGQFGKRTWRLPGYGLILSLPILVWQLLFCSALAVSADHQFWLVRNFRMVPAFEWLNWKYLFSREYFWDAYLHTWAMAAGPVC